MAQRILVRSDGGPWRDPSTDAYRNERELQRLVAESPELLTGEPLATVSEFGLPGTGFVDIVGLAQDGSITVAECKLNVNSEIRRTVVGQLFAYAAAMSRLTWDQFSSQWQARNGGTNPVADVAARLGVDPDPEEFRIAVEDKLRSGSFNLIFIVDQITPELKQVIEYTNNVTRDDVSVLGVELQLAREGTTEILVPRLWGESVVEAKRARADGARKWNPDTFGREVANLDPDLRRAVTEFMEYGREHGGRPYWGEGDKPRMAWYFTVNGTELSLFQVHINPSGPAIAIHFSGLSRSKSTGIAVAHSLLRDLKQIAAIAPHLAGIEPDALGKVPAIPVAGVLDDMSVRRSFMGALDRARAVTG